MGHPWEAERSLKRADSMPLLGGGSVWDTLKVMTLWHFWGVIGMGHLKSDDSIALLGGDP